MIGISACLITKNEANIIERCLKNITDVADEIVVVDGHSTDDTLRICRKYNVRIFEHDWPGSFSKERNYCISKASREWILTIAPDETLSKDLKRNIRKLIQNKAIDGYYINRIKLFNGQPLLHGKAYPDYQLCLFRKNKGKYFRSVHETVALKGRSKRLNQEWNMFHDISFDLGEFRKNLRYARMHAKETQLHHLMLDIVSILYGFLLKRGFLDGWKGMQYHAFKLAYTFSVMYFIVKNKLGMQ